MQNTETEKLKRRFSPLKDVFAMLTAALMLLTGAGMSVYSLAAFGDVRTGVLFYVAQALIYAGSIFGVSVYWNAKMRQAIEEMELVLTQDAAAILAMSKENQSVDTQL